jgi:squalene synthase HpnC
MTRIQARPAALHGENFPVALGVLPRRYRTHLWAVYRYARHVDNLGDEASGDRSRLLAAVAAQLAALYDGGVVTEPIVAQLRPSVAECRLPREPLLRLVRAGEMDQVVHRYGSFTDLLAYCELSANPVGELVLHIFGSASPDQVALSDRICTGLQLLEHLQDVAEDYRAGRVYLPEEDLSRFAVDEDELGQPEASPRVRALIAFETDRATAWLNAGAVLVSTLRGWARLAVSGYLAGGRAAAARLRASGFDPLPAPPKPTAGNVAAAWLTAIGNQPG